MRALLLREVGVLEMVDIDPPSPSEGELTVEVAAAGICGSDVHSAKDGGLLREPPIVMGHEFSGTIGSRRVVVNPLVTCGGKCRPCREGFDNLCAMRSIIGIQQQGGFADRVAVPESCLVDLPDGVSLQAGALVEPLAVALHAIRLAPLEAGTRVGVLGAGTIGLLAAFLCAAETDEVSVTDLDSQRLEHARRVGATWTGSELQGEFDIIIDAVGVPATRTSSVAHLRPRGTAVWIGNERPESPFDSQAFVRTEKRILGSAAYTQRDFRDAAGLTSDSLLQWTTTAELADGPSIMYDLMEPKPGSPIKVLLQP